MLVQRLGYDRYLSCTRDGFPLHRNHLRKRWACPFWAHHRAFALGRTWGTTGVDQTDSHILLLRKLRIRWDYIVDLVDMKTFEYSARETFNFQVALLFSAAAAAGPYIGLTSSLQMLFGFKCTCTKLGITQEDPRGTSFLEHTCMIFALLD